MEYSVKGVGADVVRMIIECDRRYAEERGCVSEAPECNMCKKLLEIGYVVTEQSLPHICINYCARWDASNQFVQA